MEQKGPTEICWKLILEMAGAEAGAEAKARLVIFSYKFHQHTFGDLCF